MSWDALDRRRWWALIAIITAVGLALRIAGSLGGLWLDEAVSAIHARDTGAAMGVFLKINHDNNHHITSLWMQMVGFGAPPLAVRALSIVAGTAAIVVAGLLGRRRSAVLGLITAAAFAVSPILVTLGGEARGYAGMSLALLIALLLTDRWLAGDAAHSPSMSLAICFFLGAFSQLIMVFAFFALAGWVIFALWHRDGLKSAVINSARLLGPSVVALGLVGAIIAGAAAASPAGFKFGGYDPFSWMQYLRGLSDVAGHTLGFPEAHVIWFALVPSLVILAPRSGVSRPAFHLLAILGFPLMIALLQPGNVGYARYYLLVGIALLILGAELAWLGLAAGGARRWLAAAGLVAFAGGSIACNVELIRNQRADPAAAIVALRERAPAGARVFVARDQGLPILIYAAAAARYPLAIADRDCPPARFLFVDRFKGEDFPAAVRLCGRRYAPIAAARALGLSGTHWTLYERRP